VYQREIIWRSRTLDCLQASFREKQLLELHTMTY
jgi:hypothetical protein